SREGCTKASPVHFAGHVGVAGVVDRDAVPVVLAWPAQIGRIEDGSAWRELGDEDVRAPAERTRGAGRRRKIRRACRAGDVEVSGPVAREGDLAPEVDPSLVTGAAEIRRIGDSGSPFPCQRRAGELEHEAR